MKTRGPALLRATSEGPHSPGNLRTFLGIPGKAFLTATLCPRVIGLRGQRLARLPTGKTLRALPAQLVAGTARPSLGGYRDLVPTRRHRPKPGSSDLRCATDYIAKGAESGTRSKIYGSSGAPNKPSAVSEYVAAYLTSPGYCRIGATNLTSSGYCRIGARM